MVLWTCTFFGDFCPDGVAPFFIQAFFLEKLKQQLANETYSTEKINIYEFYKETKQGCWSTSFSLQFLMKPCKRNYKRIYSIVCDQVWHFYYYPKKYVRRFNRLKFSFIIISPGSHTNFSCSLLHKTFHVVWACRIFF